MNTNTPHTFAIRRIDGKTIEHEISCEMAPDHQGRHRSLVVLLRFEAHGGYEGGKAIANLIYEVNGHHQDLAVACISTNLYAELTGNPVTPQQKIQKIASVRGNVTICDGVAWLPDGSSINLE